MSSAKIQIWNSTVGYLYWDEPNQTVLFEPDKTYLESKFNIAPILHPDKPSRLSGNDYPRQFKGMIPTFNDSLPDSFGNTIFKEWLEQMDIDQSEMNPVERLLYVGNRGIGALEYQIGKTIANTMGQINLNELADISNKIIERKYDQKDYLHNPEALKNILTIGSSVGGAQAKILIAQTSDNKLLAGDVIHQEAVDYYIVKLEHNPQNIWHREKNYVELIYNEIARDIGLNVAESKLIREGERAHFASKRFDRVNNKKIHKQTVNALTGFWGKSLAFGYKDIFRIIEYLKLPQHHAEQLFTQMVFNVVMSNRDDHTKNFSFLMNEGGEWSLSPAYDLTFPRDPYESYGTAHQIHINGKTKNISRQDLTAVANLAGIRNFNPLIDKVIDHAVSFQSKAQAFDLNKNTTRLIAKEINENIDRLQSIT